MTLRLALVCSLCPWEPDDDLTMGVVRAHFETEHPDAEVPETDDGMVTLDLAAFCTRCAARLTEPHIEPLRGGGERHTYDCMVCHRSYRIRVG